MSIIWTCRHIRDFQNVKRLTNLQGVIFADCGQDEHFSNIRKPGTTNPFPIDHFPDHVATRAAQLPINCSAWWFENQWYIDSFQDNYLPQKNDIVCLSVSEFSQEFSESSSKSHLYIKVNEENNITILRHESGMRFLPIWYNHRSSNSNLGNVNLINYSSRRMNLLDFHSELENLADRGVEFCNVMYGKQDYQKLILIWELLDRFEENDFSSLT